ncbi:MAG TPA: hypothetical protein VFU89_08560 [Rhabdochlamydiaceae bacterium]|nr:hypothetical protein [Rhabdochlamydiaceae bacterium]
MFEGCDCSAFERRDGYISCESLMVGEISSLQGKIVPRDLFDMDKWEYAVITAEEIALKRLSDEANRQVLVVGGSLLLCASLVIAAVCLAFGNVFAATISFGVGMLSGVVSIVANRTEAKKNKIQEIDDNRLARLRNKVGVLERKIAVTMDESKEDLIAAKDFFKTKHEIYLARKIKRCSSLF